MILTARNQLFLIDQYVQLKFSIRALFRGMSVQAMNFDIVKLILYQNINEVLKSGTKLLKSGKYQ